MTTLKTKQSVVPMPGGHAIRGGGVYGAALREIRDDEDNWGVLPSQAGTIYGDVINGTKEVFWLGGYFSGNPALYNPGIAVPMLDTFNALNGMASSPVDFFGGRQIVATADQTDDVVGRDIGRSVEWIAGSNFLGSFCKLGSKMLQIVSQLRTLSSPLMAAIGILGFISGGLFCVMFIAILALTYYKYCESNRFSETFKNVLKMSVSKLEPNHASCEFDEVWSHSNPQKMYQSLTTVLERRGLFCEETFAALIQLHLRSLLDKRDLDMTIRDWAQEVILDRGALDLVVLDNEGQPRSLLAGDDTSKLLHEMRAHLERDSRGNHYALLELNEFETSWNDRVNFVHAFERATKDTVVEEIATGSLVSDQVEDRQEIDAIRSRLTEIFGVPALEGDAIYKQIAAHRQTAINQGGPNVFEVVNELSELEDRLNDVQMRLNLNRNPSKVVGHMLQKWKVERDWNIALAAVVAVALVVLMITLVAPFFITAPLLSVALSFAWIAICIAFLVFDVKSFIEAYKSAQGGKLDAIIMTVTGVALAVVTIATIALTTTAGLAPLIFLGIVGGIIGIIHIASCARVANRTAEARRKRMEEAANETQASDLPPPAYEVFPGAKSG